MMLRFYAIRHCFFTKMSFSACQKEDTYAKRRRSADEEQASDGECLYVAAASLMRAADVMRLPRYSLSRCVKALPLF